MNLPFVSVIVPTYNRRKFLPYVLYQFRVVRILIDLIYFKRSYIRYK